MIFPVRPWMRAATVLALSRGGQAPFPTMAGPAVFDTRLLPIEDLLQEGMTPVALVYTDADKLTSLDRNGGRNYRRELTLIIEIAIGSVGRTPDGADKKWAWAETDAELETLLDLFEFEVWNCLHDGTNPYTAQWRQVVKGVEDWESIPFRSAEQANRYAVRQIHAQICLRPDCYRSTFVGAQPPRNVPTTPLIPIPYLAELSQQVAEAPIFQSTRDLLLDNPAQPESVLPLLTTISLKVDAIDPMADPNRLPPGVTKGPDGRIEVQADIRVNE